MRKLEVFCLLFLLIGTINAQIVENPVFDRTDVSAFRVQKIEVKKDTTFVYCLFSADEHSWANISKKTFLEDVRNGERYPILKVSGIPFEPEKRHFSDTEEVCVVLYFPSVTTDRINIIESEDENAFNIYGIDLTRTYNSTYTSADINNFFEIYQQKDENGELPSALEYTQKQLDATNYVEGIRSFASACSMYNMMMVLFELKDYKKEIEWGDKAIDILRELPQDSIYLDVLARAYGNVGTAYYLLQEYDYAKEYMELSLATRRFKDGIGTLNYDEYLKYMMQLYYKEGNIPRALLYAKEMVTTYREKYERAPNKYFNEYLKTLNALCEFQLKAEQMEEALETGKRITDLINKSKDEIPILTQAAAYNNVADLLIQNGKTDEGIALLELILEYAKNGLFYNKEEGLKARTHLATAYLDYKQDTIRALSEYKSIINVMEDTTSSVERNGHIHSSVLKKLYEFYWWSDPDTALLYLNRAIDLNKKWNGDNSIAYASVLFDKVKNLWIPCMTENKDLDSLFLYTYQAAKIIKRHMNNSSHNMSKNEYKAYWSRYGGLFTWFIPTLSGLLGTDTGNSLAYDAALFYKGMLLSSERDFKYIIQNSRDDNLILLYKDYSCHLIELENLYSTHFTENQVDSLKSLIHDEEFLLSQKVTRLNQHYKGTNYSWEEVKGQLGKNDIAIEIISYQGIDGQNIYYDAYVIGHNYKAPQLIRLCSEEKLKALTTDSIDYGGLSVLFWGNKKMHDVIKDAKNIYFSAAGLFNTIGIEYLPIAENQYIYDRFNLYRLSSTRELCLNIDTKRIDNAYLYGGLNYNSNTEQSTCKETIPNRFARSIVEDLTHRGGFDFLIGSMQEVELIKSELSKHNMECKVYSGSSGTEESVKKLSGGHLGILHLSTHGMYVPVYDESIRGTKNFRFIISDKIPGVGEEEISLSHSFLVMSGGNALIYRDSIPMEQEDGILTALEISHLDFTSLDLVVLSACETAQGRIDAEGVYGLQRGFKKAGVNTILMSLDKVDDEATKILMVEFYKNLMSGKTKLQSLKDAQQHLKTTENGKYSDPKYWASFIMLDGLN